MKTDFFSIKLLENLPSDRIDALAALCEEFDRFKTVARTGEEFHEDYLEIHSILKSFIEFRKIDFVGLSDVSSHHAPTNIRGVLDCFNNLKGEIQKRKAIRHAEGHVASKSKHYSALFSGISQYEFSDTDYKRIQTLINELRELIVNNEAFSEGHRSRLLKRLEAMQGELHKKTSDIDRFWGFIGEVGINIRKFGESMKPISERVQELGKIVIAVIYAKEGIPLPPEVSKFLLPDK